MATLGLPKDSATSGWFVVRDGNLSHFWSNKSTPEAPIWGLTSLMRPAGVAAGDLFVCHHGTIKSYRDCAIRET